MTVKEVDRANMMNKIQNKEITQKEAAATLNMSERQIRRVYKNFIKYGINGITSKKKGGNRSLKSDFKNIALNLIKENYADFKPTFATEKLKEIHQIDISRETVRKMMFQEGFWKGKKRKKACIHQSRERRMNIGELIQIDGSFHDWFEGRASKCCLLVFIDDATSRLMQLRFENSETTLGYFRCIKEYVLKHGVPLAFYSDKASAFVVNRPDLIDKTKGETQFQRAIKELGIKQICAHSPQAKGRVERANATLQDRLIKEMRLRKINNMEEANAYLPEFIKQHNERFACIPAGSINKHKTLSLSSEQLDLTLSCQETRKLSKNLEFSYCSKIYQIKRFGTGYSFRNAAVVVCEKLNGEIVVLRNNEVLKYEFIEKNRNAINFAESKEINSLLDTLIAENATISTNVINEHRSEQQPSPA